MNKLRLAAGGFCAVIAAPAFLAYAQEWLPKDTRPAVIVGLGVLLIAYAAWWMVDLVPAALLRLTRGVTAIASDRGRRHQFSQPWEKAKSKIWAWGVGMTSLSRDVDVIRATVQRGVRIVLEVTDAQWVRDRAETMAMIDATYGRANFVDQIEDSTSRLVALARDLNLNYGADRVEVWAVSAFIPQSGTVADPDSPRAWGWVEWHTYGFPNGQLRLRMSNYVHRSKLNPPLLEHLLHARRAVSRRRIDISALPTPLSSSGGAATP